MNSRTVDQGVSYDVHSNYYGFFLQDDWRLTRKLTLNLGLRYEYEGAIRERNGNFVVGFDPRVPSPLATAALSNYNASLPGGIPLETFQNLRGGLLFADSRSTPQQ